MVFCKIVRKTSQKREKYNKVKKVVLVAIIDFEIKETKELKEMETIWKIIETKNRDKILTEELEIHIIEMKKARESYEKNKDNKKAQWIMFLNDPNSREVKEIMENNRGGKRGSSKSNGIIRR